MQERERLVERFEAHRGHLKAVAYRMLGSTGEADDAVQEAWLRLSRSDAGAVENLGGWPTTVVSRVCLDMLRSRRSRREAPLEEPDVRVPDPILGREDRVDSEQEALMADLGRPGAARGAAGAVPGGTSRVRAARHVRRALQRDLGHRRTFSERCEAAREPGAPAGTGDGRGP
jgi:DNA-directed RNA polymerase specialized sigma24 family protein